MTALAFAITREGARSSELSEDVRIACRVMVVVIAIFQW
jgi:hypothetical protein